VMKGDCILRSEYAFNGAGLVPVLSTYHDASKNPSNQV
jgi:hypothetical protein